MNLFQSIVLAIFAFIAIAAVMIFSATSNTGGSISYAGTFRLWGVLPADSLEAALDKFNAANSKNFNVEYTEKRPGTFQGDLVSALAAGNGPDLVILPDSLIVQNMDKVLLIPYDLYPVRNFSDTFIDGASLFMSKEGIFGMPLYVDPLVMYWNKDIFSTGGVASYPTKWGEFENLAGRLTISDRVGNISQSAVAMGSYLNIEHAKDIIATLFMQAGSELVRFVRTGEMNSLGVNVPYIVSLRVSDDNSELESALRFYLDFSNSVKKVYSWNVAMPNSKTAFASGILAVYFGHASDYSAIQKINPHLNFDVAVLPQRDTSKSRVTIGSIYGIAVTKGAKDAATAKQVAINMSGADFVKSLSEAISLPPARRDLLSLGAKDPVASVFYSSAIISKTWLDPLPSESNLIFREMVESVLSGTKAELQAVNVVSQRLSNLIVKKN